MKRLLLIATLICLSQSIVIDSFALSITIDDEVPPKYSPPSATLTDFKQHRQYRNRVDGPTDKTAEANPVAGELERWILQYTNGTQRDWTDFHIRISADAPNEGDRFSAANESVEKVFLREGFGSDFPQHPNDGPSPEFFFERTNKAVRNPTFKGADFSVSEPAKPLKPGETVQIEVQAKCLAAIVGCGYRLDVQPTSVPEPSTMVFTGTTLLLLGYWGRKRLFRDRQHVTGI